MCPAHASNVGPSWDAEALARPVSDSLSELLSRAIQELLQGAHFQRKSNFHFLRVFRSTGRQCATRCRFANILKSIKFYGFQHEFTNISHKVLPRQGKAIHFLLGNIICLSLQINWFVWYIVATVRYIVATVRYIVATVMRLHPIRIKKFSNAKHDFSTALKKRTEPDFLSTSSYNEIFSLLDCCWSLFFCYFIYIFFLHWIWTAVFFVSINVTLSAFPLFTKTAQILSNKTAIVSYELNRQRSIKHKSKLSVQKRWNTTNTDIWILSGFDRIRLMSIFRLLD